MKHIRVGISSSDQQNPDCRTVDRTNYLASATRYCKEIRTGERDLQTEIELSHLSQSSSNPELEMAEEIQTTPMFDFIRN